jgi:hypothetical protein
MIQLIRTANIMTNSNSKESAFTPETACARALCLRSDDDITAMLKPRLAPPTKVCFDVQPVEI